MEGFGIAVVEAQLAGLRMLLSLGIPDDPLLPTASVSRLPLAAGAEVWAQAAIELLRQPAPSRLDALAALGHSPTDMESGTHRTSKLISMSYDRNVKAKKRDVLVVIAHPDD